MHFTWNAETNCKTLKFKLMIDNGPFYGLTKFVSFQKRLSPPQEIEKLTLYSVIFFRMIITTWNSWIFWYDIFKILFIYKEASIIIPPTIYAILIFQSVNSFKRVVRTFNSWILIEIMFSMRDLSFVHFQTGFNHHGASKIWKTDFLPCNFSQKSCND